MSAIQVISIPLRSKEKSVKYSFRPHYLWVFAVASSLLIPRIVFADDTTATLPDADNSGLTILNNATNVTHWGLGVGVGLKASPYVGYGVKVSPFPLIYFDNKYVHVLGTGLDVKIGKWYGVSVALNLQYGLGAGYKASDAPILNGMESRNGAFWVGPSLKWETPYGNMSGNFTVSGSKGQKAEIGFGKKIDFGRFSVEPHIGAQYFSAKYVDYYYGVRPEEALSNRPAYTGTATYNESIGAKFGYRLTQNQALSVDLGVEHLGSGITDSPLIGKRFVPQARLGYLYQFK